MALMLDGASLSRSSDARVGGDEIRKKQTRWKKGIE